MNEKKTDQYVLGDEPPKERKAEEAAAETSAPARDSEVKPFDKVEAARDEQFKTALVKTNVTMVKLNELADRAHAHLATWVGTGTKEAYEATRRIRLEIRPLRVSVEKVGKELREEAIQRQRQVLVIERGVTEPLSELESALSAKETIYEAEILRQTEEKAKVERERVAALFKQLQAVDWPGNELMVAQMKPEEFGDALAKATENFEAVKAARKAEEDRKKREEEEAAERQKKLDEDNAKLEEDRKKFEAEKAALEAEKQKIKDQEEQREKDRLKKEADDLKAKNEAAEKENQRLRDLQAQKDKEEADRLKAQQAEENKKSEEKRLAELAPDKEKIKDWCTRVLNDLSPAPSIRDELLDEKLTRTINEVAQVLQSLAADVS